MKLRIIDFRPPKIAQLFVLSAVLLHWATPLSHLHVYSNRVAGLVLGLGGLVIMLWGWWLFRKFDTAICPTAKADHLVTSGIYRFTRNPMYLSLVSMLLALAIVVGTFPFYLAAVAYFIVINGVFCPYEERKLAEAFTAEYLAYKNRVRRWI